MTEFFGEQIERKVLVKKLEDNGYGDFVAKIFSSEDAVYTRRGRLNKSGACRQLGWKPKQLEDALIRCREILAEDCVDD